MPSGRLLFLISQFLSDRVIPYYYRPKRPLKAKGANFSPGLLNSANSLQKQSSKRPSSLSFRGAGGAKVPFMKCNRIFFGH